MAIDQTQKLATALDKLATAGFSMGPEWEGLHAICQAYEGAPLFDRGHALCHRIEGDSWNAGYWYRRAGTTPPGGTLESEYRQLKADIEDSV